MADVVIQRSTGMAQLLGAIMASVVQADAIAAATTMQFIEDVGFVPVDATKPDGEQKLRTASFRYTKKDAGGTDAEFIAELPLLSMLPIPSLQVRRAVLNLEIKVDEVVTESTPAPAAPPAGGAPPSRFERIPWLAEYSVKHKIVGRVGMRTPATTTPTPSASTKTTSTNQINAEITLAQADIPAGLQRMFDLMDMAINDRPAP